MECFRKLIDVLAQNVPDWVPLIACPVLLALCALAFTLFGGRRGYLYVAVALGGIAFFLVCCMEGLQTAALFLALYAAEGALLRLLFFIPCPLRRRKEGKKRESRAERIYERFREEQTPVHRTESGRPPKICCFEEPTPTASAEESGMRLNHVLSLLGKLKDEKLTPTDRLELDVLSRSVDAFREKILTEEELRSLNDCLASVLKLTAKYKL